MYENIQRLKLDVRQIAALHGPRRATLHDLRRRSAKAHRKRRQTSCRETGFYDRLAERRLRQDRRLIYWPLVDTALDAGGVDLAVDDVVVLNGYPGGPFT